MYNHFVSDITHPITGQVAAHHAIFSHVLIQCGNHSAVLSFLWISATSANSSSLILDSSKTCNFSTTTAGSKNLHISVISASQIT